LLHSGLTLVRYPSAPLDFKDTSESGHNTPTFLMGSYLSTALSGSGPELEDHDSSESESQSLAETTSTSSDSVSFHHPTERDVLVVRTLLLHCLPLELADMILDLAMYWPRIFAWETENFVADASSRPRNDASFVYLVTPPIPSSQHVEGADDGNMPAKVHMVRFSLCSRDQGWGGEQDLQGSRRVTYIDSG
jgi:hypothetical protein